MRSVRVDFLLPPDCCEPERSEALADDEDGSKVAARAKRKADWEADRAAKRAQREAEAASEGQD